ncbi:MAG: hypothetical protein L0228_20015 [Planctomycetes bacterium]|nr:hypothetical protein [Planctomycetota bacterium]
MFRRRLIIVALMATSAGVRAAELPQGATVLDPDIVWDIKPDVISERPDQGAYAISPDDKWIAYISKGALWKSSVTVAPAKKLVDLPDTKTVFLAMPEFRAAWREIPKHERHSDRHILLGKLPRNMIEVCSLAWTPSQDGLVYGLRRRWQSNAETARHDVLHVSTTGVVTALATIFRERFEEPHELLTFHVTRDRKYVITSTGYTPLIWDIASRKPLATSFDRLVPSATSGRFLGVEIDTRQLVIADETFTVTKRFDVTFKPQRACDLVWSADERFAICRTRLEHPSEKWVGVRIDLETGKKRPLAGLFFSERWAFTGHQGEVIRTGKSQDFFGVYADGGAGGTYISVVPDGDADQRDIARFARPRKEYQTHWRDRGPYPPVRLSRDCELFAMAFPRELQNPGYRYYLVDREGKRWPLAPHDDETQHVSPFYVVAIANGGHTILACDDTRLFSIPVATVKEAGNAENH